MLDKRTTKCGHCFNGSLLARLIQRKDCCCYWDISFLLRKYCGGETRNVAEFVGCIKVPPNQ